jgi:hypothetical protein
MNMQRVYSAHSSHACHRDSHSFAHKR